MILPETMKAMVFEAQGQALELQELPVPMPIAQQVLIKIIACGVCRTDLHIMNGELRYPIVPLIPGHEIVGIVVKLGIGVTGLKEGQLLGTRKTCAKMHCLRVTL